MNLTLPGIRSATAEDIPELGSSLKRAFMKDPMMEFIFGDTTHEEGALNWFMTAGARFGQLWGRVETAGSSPVGGAVWLRPGESDLEPQRLSAAGFDDAPLEMGAEPFGRFLTVMEQFQQLHSRVAPETHWYLMILGVDPQWQRQGLGGRLMSPVFAEADQMGLPCYLETSTEANVRFYERHGFRVGEQCTMPGGWKTWAMRREAGAAA
jgi:ribosomal protein S18 acetylase RimI-like enzyme